MVHLGARKLVSWASVCQGSYVMVGKSDVCWATWDVLAKTGATYTEVGRGFGVAGTESNPSLVTLHRLMGRDFTSGMYGEGKGNFPLH